MGFLSVKAYRMTKEAIKMFKEGDFTPDAVKDLHISCETMFTQVPIVVKNSHLMNALMLGIQKRQLENQARSTRGEEPLPDEDLTKMFKIPMAPSRLNPLILSGTISHTADEVSEFCSQSVAKLFLTEPLQYAKSTNAAAATSLGQ